MSAEKMVVGVAGAGAMGMGIAQVAASSGHKTILFDINEVALAKAQTKLSADLEQLVNKSKISRSAADSIIERTSYVTSLEAMKNCGLVIEAVLEKLEVKQQLFLELEKVVSQDCLLATNTSSLSITSIAGSSINPERVVGLHFFNPASIMPLVEIIPCLFTSGKTVDAAKSIIDSWRKITVIAKDTPGFIVNRIARPFYGEAIRIYEEGIANIITIDSAMKETGGFRMGPFELMDFIGNDVNFAVSETVWQQMFFDPRYKPSLTQKRLVEAKMFGRKSGKGYYNYVEGKIVDDNKNINEKDKHQYIFHRVLCMLMNEAIDAVYMGIANKEDIDTAMTKGVNYPNGLLKWADEYGLNKILSTLEQLHNDYSEERYRPSVLLKQMVKINSKFY